MGAADVCHMQIILAAAFEANIVIVLNNGSILLIDPHFSEIGGKLKVSETYLIDQLLGN